MEQIQIINHNGKEIVFLDLSNSSAETILQVLDMARPIIRSSPAKSVLTLTHFKNAVINNDVIYQAKEYSTNNTPFIKAAAVVDPDPLLLTILQTMVALAGRNFAKFDDLETAKNWLANYEIE